MIKDISIMKTLCTIHRFFYSGLTCPLCEKERLDSLVSRFVNTDKRDYVDKNKERQEDSKSDENDEIKEEDLVRLMSKFNVRKQRV